jgi:hypothetical protein
LNNFQFLPIVAGCFSKEGKDRVDLKRHHSKTESMSIFATRNCMIPWARFLFYSVDGSLRPALSGGFKEGLNPTRSISL